MLMAALESEETQIKGVVPIIYRVGEVNDSFSFSLFSENNFEHSMLAVVRSVSRSLSCTCTCFHLTSNNLFSLYLPLQAIPTHKISREPHLRWVESRLQKSTSFIERPLFFIRRTEAPNDIVTPTENDILVLAGGNRSKNMGNQRLRALVKELSQTYVIGNKKSRKELVDTVIHSTLHEDGGRFLKQHIEGCDTVWKELSHDQIRKVVTQSFRNSYRQRGNKGAAGAGQYS